MVFVVTDIEADGPVPGVNSMLSLASVACGEAGEDLGHFTANLHPLPGAGTDPDTMDWWRSEPQAWAAATADPQPAERVITDWVAWVRALPGRAVFVAHPLAWDGAWIDWHLRRFTGVPLVEGPRSRDLPFHGAGLDLPLLIAGTLGWDILRCRRENYPAEWLGGHAHSHRALDDARGYAHLLALLRRGGLSGPTATGGARGLSG